MGLNPGWSTKKGCIRGLVYQWLLWGHDTQWHCWPTPFHRVLKFTNSLFYLAWPSMIPFFTKLNVIYSAQHTVGPLADSHSDLFVDLNYLSQPLLTMKLSALQCLCVCDLEGSVGPRLGVEVVVEVDVAGDADDAAQVEDDLDHMQHVRGVFAELLVGVHTCLKGYPLWPAKAQTLFPAYKRPPPPPSKKCPAKLWFNRLPLFLWQGSQS